METMQGIQNLSEGHLFWFLMASLLVQMVTSVFLTYSHPPGSAQKKPDPKDSKEEG